MVGAEKEQSKHLGSTCEDEEGPGSNLMLFTFGPITLVFDLAYLDWGLVPGGTSILASGGEYRDDSILSGCRCQKF